MRQGRLWGLRIAGITLLLATAFVVWSTLRDGRPRAFWSTLFESRPEIYTRSETWVLDGGSQVRLDSFAGQPAVATFVYIDCVITCPRIVADLKLLDLKLAEAGARRPNYLLFLLDERPRTAAEIRNFRRRYDLQGERWKVLWGQPEQLRALADALAVRYEEQPDNRVRYMHTNLFAILDRGGTVLRTIRGLSLTQTEFVAEAREALP